jgi:hypothetical protein
MFRGMIILSVLAACAFAMPTGAQAPTPATTAFDGVYKGVSRESSAYAEARQQCPPGPSAPDALTITNGIARTAEGLEGTVSPQGGLVLRTPRSFRIDGQIDAQGTIRARGSGTRCTVTYVWQKQSR